jgi:hypothetical protein
MEFRLFHLGNENRPLRQDVEDNGGFSVVREVGRCILEELKRFTDWRRYG